MFNPHEFNSAQKKNKKPIVFKHYVRKFPGPAGLSPDLPPGDVEKLVSEETGMRGISNNGILLGSTYSNILLSKPCYQRLIHDYGLNELNNPLNHLTLQMVSKAFIRKAKKDMKVPFLGLLVSSVSLEHGISLKLMDPTHEVNAVVHQNIWEEISQDVKVNSAIALTQVPVIASCTVRPPITLFISKKNILSIYKETEEDQTEMKTFNSLSEQELQKTCSEWLTQMGMNPFGKASPLGSSETRLSPDHGSHIPTSNVCGGGSTSTGGGGGGGTGTNTNNKNFSWTPDDDFLKDLDLTIDDFPNSTGFSNRNSSVNSENFTPKRPKFDFSLGTDKKRGLIGEDRGFEVPRFESTLKDSPSPQKMDSGTQSPKLSQSEKLMVQEVLSGINFDDFDC